MRTNRIVWGVLLVICLALVVGCGGAREVTSCDQCNNNSNPHYVEYCVLGQSSQLYCANPCLGDGDCLADYWCVPLIDQGTPWVTDGSGDTRWVCMPKSYYNPSAGLVYRVWSDCNGNSICPSGMTCITDDTYTPNIWFCADSCVNNSDCLSDCCTHDSTGGYACAPDRPYCH